MTTPQSYLLRALPTPDRSRPCLTSARLFVVKIRNIVHKGLKRLYAEDSAKGAPPDTVDKLRKMLAFLVSHRRRRIHKGQPTIMFKPKTAEAPLSISKPLIYNVLQRFALLKPTVLF